MLFQVPKKFVPEESILDELSNVDLRELTQQIKYKFASLSPWYFNGMSEFVHDCIFLHASISMYFKLLLLINRLQSFYIRSDRFMYFIISYTMIIYKFP